MRWPAQLTANCSAHLKTALGDPNDVVAALSLAILAESTSMPMAMGVEQSSKEI